MKQIELTDYQVFITSRARENYFDAVKNKYDFYQFWEENCQYHLALYTIIGPQDPLTFGTDLTSKTLDELVQRSYLNEQR